MQRMFMRSHAQNVKHPPISPSAASTYQSIEVNPKVLRSDMTLATVLYLSVICVGMCASADAPLACNVKAISATARPRYNDIVRRLRIAVTNHSELSNGYIYKLDE